MNLLSPISEAEMKAFNALVLHYHLLPRFSTDRQWIKDMIEAQMEQTQRNHKAAFMISAQDHAYLYQLFEKMHQRIEHGERLLHELQGRKGPFQQTLFSN